ncbi:hypothetical protein X777_02877 [Ooceraea biroi]|uniref:PDZ domain-containing protein n=1 Tax=Ooceraea biroi TaxID=2015173 RepID=A0A026WMC0_OOCBI|nr:hypothetical protein X777_02877 [Ooceraea biroi]
MRIIHCNFFYLILSISLNEFENCSGVMSVYTGSSADNADTLEVGDEILEVNGRTLENATHNEVIQYIYECIKSRTISLRVRRRSRNKMGESIRLHISTCN